MRGRGGGRGEEGGGGAGGRELGGGGLEWGAVGSLEGVWEGWS